MWLIVGLGNPGRAYSKTRHNLGYMVIDAMAVKFSIPLDRETKNCVYGKGTIAGQDVILVKPITFMNKSGAAVAYLLKKFMRIENIVVLHDDLDINTGRLKIRENGSSAGHRGIESIIESTGTENFIRLKIGIGRPESISPEEYVLK
ncbi:MAG: aminoacyl-tRNA hydrolase, partial [Nitrospirae bacterium]|nr:aminoacyl-tRNA hydrolase [Nitrospirota bacterium]